MSTVISFSPSSEPEALMDLIPQSGVSQISASIKQTGLIEIVLDDTSDSYDDVTLIHTLVAAGIELGLVSVIAFSGAPADNDDSKRIVTLPDSTEFIIPTTALDHPVITQALAQDYSKHYFSSQPVIARIQDFFHLASLDAAQLAALYLSNDLSPLLASAGLTLN